MLAASPFLVQAQLSDTLWPPLMPLAVRSPYLSAWITLTSGPTNWPGFWTDPGLGWAGLIRVDNNITYGWQGNTDARWKIPATIQNVQVTPTRTIVSLVAGPVDFNVTFLSPIEPADPVKQSFPFTYFAISAVSNDGANHEVQVYSDITTEWVSGDRNALASWNTTVTDEIIYHQSFLASPKALSEANDQAIDGTVYLAALHGSSTTYQTGRGFPTRDQFVGAGQLKGTTSTSAPSPISSSDGDRDVFAIAMDLGTVSSLPASAVWALGMLRDPVVQAVTTSGAADMRSPAWRTQASIQEAGTLIKEFLQDYVPAMQRAEALDLALATQASAVSPHLADLVSLATRQVMGSTELTVNSSANGLDTADIRMYMKNIGVSSPSGRMNPVEVMYAAFPFFLAVNASYGGWLLKPVLEYASSPKWSEMYAPGDLGATYPQTSANSVPSTLDIEETGNMLIMVLAHARASGDGSLISQYYQLLKQWADYLVNNTSPLRGNSVTSDNPPPQGSPNLALKGIIAIGAMAQMSEAAQQPEDAEHYLDMAQSYAISWRFQALSSSQHILATFGDSDSSWALPYNLFADKWVGTNLFEASLFDTETYFFQGLMGSSSFPNGLQVSDTDTDINTAWIMFTASIMTDSTVRDSMIDSLWAQFTNNTSNQRLSTILVMPRSSDLAGSPGVGAIFAHLASSIANATIVVPNANTLGPGPAPTQPDTQPDDGSHVSAGAIAGASVGGVCVLVICLVGALVWHRRRRGREGNTREAIDEDVKPHLLTDATPYPYAREYHDHDGPDTTLRVALGTTSTPASKGEQLSTLAYSPSSATEARSQDVVEPAANSSAAQSGGGSEHAEGAPVLRLQQEVESLRQVIQRLEPPPTYDAGI
ncbi:DUF5127 and DUF1793 domain-containing protein [Phanerochaete sordida]|uniref:DUF5127 and DUF1793 domain-containing protein n=1 Tax=Phanerochaete sordida TaxID=48140 RepID=A0A9P3GHQ2_9APHY|nr:DUF5127 and DUF1793 domain-containing protein [Phanerochaete sordida]